MSLIEEEDRMMSNMKMYSWGAGIIAALFTTMTAWLALDLPRWAFISEVDASSERLEAQISRVSRSVERMSEFNTDTRSLLLDQEWWRFQREVEFYKSKSVQDPTTKELIRRLLQSQSNITKQLDALKVAKTYRR